MGNATNRAMVVLAVAILLIAPGCPRKKAPIGEAGATGGIGEEATQGGSLDIARRGDIGRPPSPMADIHFDYDSFELREDARQILQKNAMWLKENSRVRVELEGHCDERGTVEYNLALGAKRAAAAKSYLVSLGIPAERITTISYGEELPLCREATESCWAQNRRAHFVPIGE